MNADLPYVAEYAKSARASCKVCKENIGKDSLRMGVMVQSPHFDGKVPNWHHLRCFFQKKKVKSTADIANFDNLRWEDQKKIKEKMEGSSNGSTAAESSEYNDFSVESAKSSRSMCKLCGEKIMKGNIRISKLDTDSPNAQRFGPIPGWRHVDCFVKVREELEFTDSADKLPGYQSLPDEDKAVLNEKITRIGGVKRKAEDQESEDSSSKKSQRKEEKVLKIQSQLLFDMRDKLKARLSKKEMITLLEYNDQHISTGESNLLDHLADCLIFGSLKTCPECKNAKPRFKIDGYRCSGNVTEWTKCQYVTRSPEREPFRIPDEFKEKYEFLKDYKFVKRERTFNSATIKASTSKKGLPLENCKITLFGRFKIPKEVLMRKVDELGGTNYPKIDDKVMCCISTEAEVAKDGQKVIKAKSLDLHIVSPNFLDAVKGGTSPAVAIKENSICSWGGDPILKFGIKQEKPKKVEVTEHIASMKSAPQTMKITVRGAAAVDPDSGLEHKAHVYQKKDEVFNVVLGKVDIARGTNTYYKLQILESNKRSKYWLFRSWGRVGTTIGGDKSESMSLDDTVIRFKELYLEKTGNDWSNRKNFVKQPGLLYPLDIDYGQEAEELRALKPGANSKLSKPVQELVCLIFDIEAMKKAMLEFEIDLNKMPLGKLSKKQIEMAYSVLTEAQQVLVTGCNATKILDASNRFYTLIPHDFGLKKPPLLDDEELIKLKIEMLDSLLEIEFAYNLLKEGGTEGAKDPVDEHYEKLKTDIEVLNKDSEEFRNIKTYLTNTHAKTHDNYSLVLDEVYKIDRSGEKERYQKFKDLTNKKLLWHGSRLTNYVGILSQGLRIAPPEAPATGYMFGKGIYFADMVSKSANYCCTNKKNPTALMLLCEVALGNMYERTTAEYVEKLPKDKHSTKGLGQTMPDPNGKTWMGDVEIPCGKPVQSGVQRSQLLYNEYIVYDINQVNAKYLLKVNFKWKY